MAGTLNKQIARVWFDEVTVGFGVPLLAELSGYSTRTISNWCEGVCSPPLDKTLHVVRVISQEDPPRGLRMWDRISALAAMEAHPAAAPVPHASIASLAFEASAAEGEVSAWAAEALKDGTVDSYESPEGEKRARKAGYAFRWLLAAIKGVSLSSPQRSLGVR
jgi:hypothetical protein